MKSQPSPTTSTEPPTRIPKPINAVQPDVVLDQATKATLTSNPDATVQSGGEEVLYERTPNRPLTPEELKQAEWVPRPLWQRAGLSLLVLAGGTGIAAALLLAQSRTITRIVRLSQATKARVETARNWPGKGKVVDFTEITARKGRDETEMIITLPGSRGEFLVGLDRAKIRGEAGDLGRVRQNFNHTFSQWKGLRRETNPVSPGLGRWKSGPAA
ncbi:hypothetical protein RSAG8_05872, partial [Rhizoctonia solani AG-8 WAC10335]